MDEPAGTVARRRLRPEDRRAQLVALGAQVFVERGYAATTLEDIAVGAGVTRPLIYHYFRDKDELYREILHGARAELDIALVSAAAAETTPAAQLHAGFAAYFRFVRDQGRLWDLMFGGGAALAGDLAEDAARLRHETAEKIGLLLHAAAPHLDDTAISAYAYVISGAGEQLAKWWRRHPHVDLDTVLGYQLDVVWGGLERLSTP